MNAKTYTEVRFFKWKEDEVSVSLRAASASYGGAARFLLYVARNQRRHCLHA